MGKKIIQVIGILFTFVAVFILGYGVGYSKGNSINQPEEVVKEDKDRFDLELPGEVEKKIVTVEDIETKLSEIGELSTYTGSYNCSLGEDETRYIFENIPIWGSTNSILIDCEGIVKVGYDISEINVKVDDDKIYISIPESKLNDNYVIWDTVNCEESNNILNPIEFSQYKEMISVIEEKGLEDATDDGVFDRAEDNLKHVITNFLAEFDDYEIVFM